MSTSPDKVFNLHQKITEISRTSNNSHIILGEFLLDMKEGNRYKTIAGADASWASYLASPEVKITYSSASRYMAIVKRYIKELGLPYERISGLDTSSLYYCAKVVTKENVDEWLAKIENLSRDDIKRLVKYPTADAMTCQHDFIPMPMKWKCSKCGEITLNHSSLVPTT